MSRRARTRRALRVGKYYEKPSPFVVEPLARASSVAARRDDPLRYLSGEERDLALGVLRLLDQWQVVWDGYGETNPRGFGSYEIASRLSVGGARSHRALRDALTLMRRLGLVHHEFERGVDREVRWWITARGLEAAALASSGAVVG